MYTTTHADKRMKDRTPVKKRSVDRFLCNARENGITIHDLKHNNKLYKYITHLSEVNGKSIIIYANVAIVLDEETDLVITILNLPKTYQKLASKEIEKKRRIKENDQRTDYQNEESAKGRR